MKDEKFGFYWIGKSPPSDTYHLVHWINNIEELPQTIGNAICINNDTDEEIDSTLTELFTREGAWSWSVFTTRHTELSKAICDGLFEPLHSFALARKIKQKAISVASSLSKEPLVGWLGLSDKRRIKPLKYLNSPSIYTYPIVNAFYPEATTSHRYVLSEKKRNIIESDLLVDRIRACKHCNSSHLNYIEVCPHCNSIDIETQSSLHCFTCGNVSEQQSFLRRGKLECPKCLTQLRHIGVDYDRPLENYHCNSCSSFFIETATRCQCFSCNQASSIDELIIQKIEQFKLGEAGEYLFYHGKLFEAPELSIKGKVDIVFFHHLLSWANKVALRHEHQHLLLAIYLPVMKEFEQHHCSAQLFALMEQITDYLSQIFRDTDICCQLKQDLLMVFMPHTSRTQLNALEEKLSKLSELIQDKEFTLDVYSWMLPDEEIDDQLPLWLEARIGEIYASR
ncbi:diguanylate cyclase [Vibrio fluminensis]|uniref:TackOD1 domain-containing metal-binding protein n=1 Tax=Vibrio fluminensis TaxID=2783614 RepID=UPI0018890A16|nr:diguanylate cyclase [Vibrio fluminensis]